MSGLSSDTKGGTGVRWQTVRLRYAGEIKKSLQTGQKQGILKTRVPHRGHWYPPYWGVSGLFVFDGGFDISLKTSKEGTVGLARDAKPNGMK